ncbi:hypothetical protein [Sediminivirga luteola]|nr:hypothetical protein [Sediminivirga luteola]
MTDRPALARRLRRAVTRLAIASTVLSLAACAAPDHRRRFGLRP